MLTSAQRLFGVILLVLLLSAFVFAIIPGPSPPPSGGGSSGDSGSGTSSRQAPTPDIFITGDCTGKEVAISVSTNGTAVVSASISVTEFSSTRPPRMIATLRTDSNGVATFTPTDTSYTIEVSHSEVQTTSKSFTLRNCTADTTASANRSTANLTTGEGLACGDMETMRERIRCRITQEESDNLTYVPEICRVMSGENKSDCLTDYNWQQRCRHLDRDAARESCYRAQVNLSSSNISQLRKECGQNDSCVQELRKKVFGYVRFRLYNLEEKVEKLKERGILTEDQAVDFITVLEGYKLQFENATTVADKKAVIQNVQSNWQTMKQTVVNAIRERLKTGVR